VTVFGPATSGRRRGRRRPVVPGRRRVNDRQTSVEGRLTADSALFDGQRQTRMVRKAETTWHALANQRVGEVT